MSFEIGDIVVSSTDGRLIGEIVEIFQKRTGAGIGEITYRTRSRDGRVFFCIQNEIKLYCERYPFKIGDIAISWYNGQVGEVIKIDKRGIFCKHNDQIYLFKPSSLTHFTKSIINKCPDCKGTGKILLLNSYVKCKCKEN